MKRELLYYFEGLDKTVLNLNPYLHDFKFLIYDLTKKEDFNKFKNKFKDFIIEVDKESLDFTLLPISNLSANFMYALERSAFFNQTEVVKNNYIIFLQDLKIELSEILNKDERDEERKRLDDLIKKFKLFKSGHIKLLTSFKTDDYDEGYIPEKFASPTDTVNYEPFFLSDQDLNNLKYFEKDVDDPEYAKLAVKSFIEYYNVDDKDLKFTMLMIALESIFNKHNQDPIRHIISRHCAIVLTMNEKADDERKKLFNELYKKVQKLYDIRCKIVHGGTIEEKTKLWKKYFSDYEVSPMDELETIVRKVLQKMIWIYDPKLRRPENKEEFWDYLNAKGFSG